MPTWTCADVETELKDTAAFLGHKKAGSESESVRDMEDKLMKGIISKIKSLTLTSSLSLSLYKVLDEQCTAFSNDMKTQIKAAIDCCLCQPGENTEPIHTVKPQNIELPQFLTQQEWGVIMNSNSYHEKIKVLTQRCSKLGIKSLSEQAVGSLMACVLCSLTSTPDPEAMYQMSLDVKLAFTPCSTSMPYMRKYPEDPSKLPHDIVSSAYEVGHGPAGCVPDKYSMMLGEVILRSTNKKLKAWRAKHNPQQKQAALEDKKHQPETNTASSGSHGGGDMPPWFLHFMNFQHAMHQRNMYGSPKKPASPKGKLALTNNDANPSVDQASAKQFAPKLRLSQKFGGSGLPIQDTPLENSQEQEQKTEVIDKSPANEATIPETQPHQNKLSGKDIEQAAFDALKSKQAAAKAKASAKAKAQAKGKAACKPKRKAQAKSLKRPASRISKSDEFSYEVEEPEERWRGKYDSWCSKHYHTCRNMAASAGFEDEQAKQLGKNARQKAACLYKKVFG